MKKEKQFTCRQTSGSNFKLLQLIKWAEGGDREIKRQREGGRNGK